MTALILAQVEPPRVQGLDDLVDRLLAEVRDGVQLALGLRDQVADGLDARPLEAVIRTHPELELLDEDVVHRARGPARLGGASSGGGAGAPGVEARGHAERLAQLL